LVWEFPTELLELFAEVYILTHLFEGSDMAAYLKLKKTTYTHHTMSELGTPIPYDSREGQIAEARRLTKVAPKIASIGSPGSSLKGLTHKSHPSKIIRIIPLTGFAAYR